MGTGIVVIGSVFVDIKGYPLDSTSYVPNGRNAGRVLQVHGGVCRNVVEDIANVELRPTFVSLVDDNGSGTDVIDKLNRHKVNTRYIRRVQDGMGTWLAVFDNSGDVYASISKRPDLSAIGEILDTCGDEIFCDADAIVLEFDMEPDLLKRVLRLAEKYNKPIYAVISNINIAMGRRDLIKHTACFVCNQQEAGVFFMEDFSDKTPEELHAILVERAVQAQIPRMVVTMGAQGAVYVSLDGENGIMPAMKVDVVDTTGAGDSFFAGVTIGLTYGKTLREACSIGTRLAASVIATAENVCPRFLPSEFGLLVPSIGD